MGKTLAAGWTPRDKVNLALDAMKPFGVTGLGLVNVNLTIRSTLGRAHLSAWQAIS